MAWVRVEHVWKRFLLRTDRADSVGRLLWQMIPGRARARVQPFWALQDVTFEVPEGKSLGIIGSNGSGKSTLLKLLTRTMQPTSGRIDTRGRISSLIELGAGFHPDFTGRENIVLNASILGVRRRDIERRMEDIIKFAEIGEFIDTPVKYYSSGMQARLGFAVAIHVEPEILVVDEVLAVGDESFQRKCMDRILAMKKQGVSILLVSHDLAAVQRLMDSAVWLEGGMVRASGNPEEVVRAYRGSLEESTGGSDEGKESLPAGTAVTGPLRPVEAYVRSEDGPPDNLDPGRPAEIVVEWENADTVPVEGYLVLSVRRPDGLEVAEISSLRDGFPITLTPGRTRVVVSLQEPRLTAGTYEVDVAFLPQASDGRADWKHLIEFQVAPATGTTGIALLPHRWSVE